MIKGYMVDCSTGCSCCSSDDHQVGPFSTQEEAERRMASFRKEGRLGSQYAEKGRYFIEERDAEVLPDGRIIIDRRVYDAWADTQHDWELEEIR